MERRYATTEPFELKEETGRWRRYVTDWGSEMSFSKRDIYHAPSKETHTVWMVSSDDWPEYVEHLHDHLEEKDSPGYAFPVGLTISFGKDEGISEDEWIECLTCPVTVATFADMLFCYREQRYEMWQSWDDEDDEIIYCEAVFAYICALYDKVDTRLQELS